VFKDLSRRLDVELGKLGTLVATDLPVFNRLAVAANLLPVK
jgi:hypothetical protein